MRHRQPHDPLENIRAGRTSPVNHREESVLTDDHCQVTNQEEDGLLVPGPLHHGWIILSKQPYQQVQENEIQKNYRPLNKCVRLIVISHIIGCFSYVCIIALISQLSMMNSSEGSNPL
jgi:hypothetical protein